MLRREFEVNGVGLRPAIKEKVQEAEQKLQQKRAAAREARAAKVHFEPSDSTCIAMCVDPIGPRHKVCITCHMVLHRLLRRCLHTLSVTDLASLTITAFQRPAPTGCKKCGRKHG